MFTLKNSIIAISGQTNKWNTLIALLLGSGFLVILGVIALVLDYDLSDQQEMIFFLVALFGIFTCCIIIFLLSVLIKCPQCNLKWFWYGISKDFKHHIMIGNMRYCQGCGYPKKRT
jgi:hypothetical protein